MTVRRTTISTTISRAAERYRRYRTQRILDALPGEIQKDIGYFRADHVA